MPADVTSPRPYRRTRARAERDIGPTPETRAKLRPDTVPDFADDEIEVTPAGRCYLRGGGVKTGSKERPWSREETECLIDLWPRALTVDAIAAILTRTVGSVNRRAFKMNLRRRPIGAATGRQKRAPPPTTRRRCITCGIAFASWGIGNRMCEPCRIEGEGYDFTAVY